ncbi:hypothetical protein [Alicyclobacillus fructus]|uniref:hypothetical protein n=1 Tax=Alicyclobacillus fructus TaxID=2816082 RepID=UPI001A8C34BA|nr:hypothetical protein [Alicyclobacillus fructus]
MGVGHNWNWDPRPDLVSDHELWELLLTQVVRDEETGWLLNACRCSGCTLEWNGTMLKLVPLIDPTLGFDSEEDWHDFRSKWLVPNSQAITNALRQLTQLALKREA